MDRANTPKLREVDVVFIPITCAVPLLYAQCGRFFERNGLSVRLRPAPSWSAIKELLTYGRVDAAHVLTPMPLASSLGIDGRPAEIRLALIQNVNGQAITLARRHADVRSVPEMKGFAFGVPYCFSMQYYLLCDFLAKHGLDPRSDVTIEEVTPPLMPYYLRNGRLDGVLAPEPYNEIAAEEGCGVIYAFSDELWPGHPCCSVATTRAFQEAHPGTFRALLRSVIEAELALHAADAGGRVAIAHEVASLAGWRGTRAEAVARVLAGRHRESGRTDRAVPRRIDFIPYPYPEYGIWILSQMQRWRQLRREVDYEGVVREVFQIDHTREIARAVGFPEHEPSLTGVAPVSAGDALECIRLQPFSEPELEPSPVARYPLPEGVRLRLGAILEWLARMTGGEPVEDLEITSDDELGWLEQTLNETVRNARFTREALDEKSDLEEQQRQAVIEAQAAVIRTLSVPILPVLDSVLVLPLIGQIDSSRAQRVMEVLLEAVSRMKAEMVLLDVTGVPRIDAEVVSRLVEIIRATALLGARCVLVGIRPELAQQLVALGDELPDLETMQDLRSGIDLALGGAGRRVAAGMGARRSG